MATTMINHSTASTWTKVADNVTGFVLQGSPGIYQVFLGDGTPGPTSGYITSPAPDGTINLNDVTGAGLWIRATKPENAGNVVNGMAF